MTYSDALNYYNAMQAQDDIARGPGGLLDTTEAMTEFRRHLNTPAQQPKQLTFGDILHGAIGAALGAGVARGASSALGLSDRFSDKLETIGLGLGAAMNTGYIKSAAEAEASLAKQLDRLDELEPKVAAARVDAFRLGFVRGLQDAGYFEKGAAVIPLPIVTLDAANMLSVPRSIGKAITSGGEVVGTGLGVADSLDETDEEVSKINVERAILEDRLEQLKADRRNAALKDILAKRRVK
jgi:hypothetical protein